MLNKLEKAICILSSIAIRKEASDVSEMVSQALFGDLMHIVKRQNNWCFIELEFDSYEGWIDGRAFAQLTETEYNNLKTTKPFIIDKPYCKATVLNNQSFVYLSLGSSIYNLDGNVFKVAGNTYIFEQIPETNEKLTQRQLVISVAYNFLNTPYLWGGRTIMGIDCSGLVQLAFKVASISMKRDAFQQAEQGSIIEFIGEAIPGDILFFENTEGRIIHTGILLAQNKIIHASGCVRIDSIDHEGIYNHEKKAYTHKLKLIKRVI